MTGPETTDSPEATDSTGAAAGPDRLLALAALAFPPRWRREHGDELFELSAELQADGARHRLAEAADLVRGGWAVRLRGRPPVRRWLSYRMMERPLPPRWHGWMRDDLEGRLLGFRILGARVWPVALSWLVVALASGRNGRGIDTWIAASWLSVGAVWVVVTLTGQPARRFRRQLWTKAGYSADGACYLVPPPPEPADLRVASIYRPWGVARKALAPVALPLGVWSIVGGTAALAGSTAPSGPFRLGPLRIDRDPNSPMTRPQVLVLAALALAVASLAVVVAGRLADRRVLAAPPDTVHPLMPLPVRAPVFAALVSVVGAAVTAAAIAGVWPDQVAAGSGAVAVVAGAVLVRLALVARRHTARLGRPVTLGDLTVGERVVMVPTPASASGG